MVYEWFGIIGVDDIEAWELEEFLEDILNAEFNLVRDADSDGTDVSSVSVRVNILIFCPLHQLDAVMLTRTGATSARTRTRPRRTRTLLTSCKDLQ